MPYIIERDSAEASEEGVRVYVVDMDDEIPGYSAEVGGKVYSSTVDLSEASVFNDRDTAETLRSGLWKGLNPSIVKV